MIAAAGGWFRCSDPGQDRVHGRLHRGCGGLRGGELFAQLSVLTPDRFQFTAGGLCVLLRMPGPGRRVGTGRLGCLLLVVFGGLLRPAVACRSR